MINGALQARMPSNGPSRMEVLQAIQWRMRGPNGEYVGLDGVFVAFVPESNAQIFCGVDNEDLKLDFYQSILGKLSIEIIPQIVTA